MPSIKVHPSSSTPPSTTKSPLPSLLHTPHGLAILEIQGTLHLPSPDPGNPISSHESSATVHPENVTETPVGRLIFPFYSASSEKDDTKWMKRVYLYVGKHQRLTGEVKKLGKPLGVIRKRRRADESSSTKGDGDDVSMMEAVSGEEGHAQEEELEVVDVIEYKILFQGRPEPVGD